MPVVGFHQARRPRQTPGARLRRELSWPRPGGVVLALAGATLVVAGALSLGGPDIAVQPSAVAASTLPSTTPATSQAPGPPATVAATNPSAAAPSLDSTLAVAGKSASPLAPKTTPPAPPEVVVKGAAAGAPIHKLFASDAGGMGRPDIFNPQSALVLANKHHPLEPLDHTPNDLVTPAVLSGSGEPVLLRAEAGAAAERMFAAAAEEGVAITAKSSYRSYGTQVAVYNGYVAQKGVAAADSTSARPGFSEHQTGLAIDIGDANAGTACDFTSCFAGTAAAQWVAAHGADYGFVVRYVPGEEPVTGYLAEPWHLRYLGVAVAQDMSVRGIQSYEQYLGLPGAPGYK